MKGRKMLVKHPSLRVSSLGILQRSAGTRTVFKPGRERYFINTIRKVTNYNLSKEEHLTLRSLQNDRSVVIKPADKGTAVVVWDRNDYLKEAERQLSDEKTYEEIRITEKDQVELVEKSNDLFSNLRRKNVITENENNYFRFNFKKATNLGKLYLLPKIHKDLCKIPG